MNCFLSIYMENLFLIKHMYIVGDYAPVHGTVIGALYHEMGLSVNNLARTKKEDLRKRFNCWISQSVTEAFPYRYPVYFLY